MILVWAKYSLFANLDPQGGELEATQRHPTGRAKELPLEIGGLCLPRDLARSRYP